MLDAHRFLGCQEELVPVDRRGKSDTFFSDLAQRAQREDLKTTRIGENGLVPAHELVQAAVRGDDLQAGAQPQMESIAEADLRADFVQAGLTQFGSGWCWIAVKDGKLAIMKTPNGENPLMHGASPILGCDVWEHSYYIDYRNLRQKYLEAFVDNLVNWEYVEAMHAKA